MRWSYYNHAMQPTCPPHEEVELDEITNGTIWESVAEKPMLVRYTTDFDCPNETGWWYVIKDSRYDISAMKSKRRYEITRGRKNFEVRQIAPKDYWEALCDVQIDAFSAYPAKYRPTVNREKFISECSGWEGVCLGAFLKDEEGNATEELCGYAYLRRTANVYTLVFKKPSRNMRRQV